jgi:hypothetical protein
MPNSKTSSTTTWTDLVAVGPPPGDERDVCHGVFLPSEHDGAQDEMLDDALALHSQHVFVHRSEIHYYLL